MEKKPIPPSIFEPIKKRQSVQNSAGKKDKVMKLDHYLSATFRRDYFSNK
jgi:hypothetical protein